MAIRQIRTIGDEILTKECKPVKEMNERTLELIEDMFETMYENNGVGLAAPQVGVRKRVVVIDVEDGNQYVLINPEILETSGSQTGQEGCLSVPGKCGQVTRADHVKAKALIWKSMRSRQTDFSRDAFSTSATIWMENFTSIS